MCSDERAKPRVALIHYTAPPVIGGVEAVLARQARILTAAGYPVRIIAGVVDPSIPGVETVTIPPMYGGSPEIAPLQTALWEGCLPEEFSQWRERLRRALEEALHGVKVVILHNVCTMDKNLTLSAALYDLVTAEPRLWIGWHHDAVILRSATPRFPGEPWDLVFRPWPVIHVTVSESRRRALAAAWRIPTTDIHVIPNGVDPGEFFRWGDLTRSIVEALGLMDADAILLMPVRITRRKRLEDALAVLHHLRERTGWDIRLLVTGPPGAHTPANQAYLEELRAWRAAWGLEGAAHFLHEHLGEGLPEEAVADLYMLADAVLLTSEEEGFGLPVLEAGLARLPVFARELPSLRELGEGDIFLLPEGSGPEAFAAAIVRFLETDPVARLRRRVRQRFNAARLIQERLIPLLEGAPF
ncbi:glycosyltransferase family 4 protein [Thermoflexus sp.]|uniref:glycosyltransferase family 4 protein n=1 Tax=Thermoflexus sp. TaxID=1969742 RepID=UPI0035E4490B